MPTVVILREVAVSMAECQGVMDSATARGMTKLEFYGYSGNGEVGVPLLLPGMARFCCYRRDDGRGAECQRSSYCAKSQYPWRSARGSWIPRLCAE